MVAFYKHDIPSWMDGTEGLSDGAYRAYHVVCQLIYLNDGPIVFNERGIAGRCNQRNDRFRKYLAELVAAGKLVVADGRISNERADHELAKMGRNRVNARTGGLKSGEARRVIQQPYDGHDDSVQSAYSSHDDGIQQPYDGHDDSVQSAYSSVPPDNPLETLNGDEPTLQSDRSLERREYRENIERDARARSSNEALGDVGAGIVVPPRPARRSKPAKAAMTPWPEGFVLNDGMRGYAEEQGFRGRQADTLFDQFHSKSMAKGWTYCDWTHAWRNFVANEIKFNGVPKSIDAGARRKPPDV